MTWRVSREEVFRFPGPTLFYQSGNLKRGFKKLIFSLPFLDLFFVLYGAQVWAQSVNFVVVLRHVLFYLARLSSSNPQLFYTRSVR